MLRIFILFMAQIRRPRTFLKLVRESQYSLHCIFDGGLCIERKGTSIWVAVSLRSAGFIVTLRSRSLLIAFYIYIEFASCAEAKTPGSWSDFFNGFLVRWFM